jgi:hypothetical protein
MITERSSASFSLLPFTHHRRYPAASLCHREHAACVLELPLSTTFVNNADGPPKSCWGLEAHGDCQLGCMGNWVGNRRRKGVQGCDCERRCVTSLLSLSSPFLQGVGALQHEQMSVYTPVALADSVLPPMLDRLELWRGGRSIAATRVAQIRLNALSVRGSCQFWGIRGSGSGVTIGPSCSHRI